MRNQSKKEEKEKDQAQIKSSAGDMIGNVKLEIKEEGNILSCNTLNEQLSEAKTGAYPN